MIGIGIDAVEVDRFRRVLARTPGVARRLFTESERAYGNRKRDPAERLAPAVENALYFIVVESLTNIAKHAEASHCSVTVERHLPNDQHLTQSSAI